jgi:hypothetical protein
VSRVSLHKRLDKLEAGAVRKPKDMLVVGFIEDAPEDFEGTIFLTGVPRPEDKVHRQCG